MRYITAKDTRIPARKKDAKKGDAGRVLIIGGSKNYAGAPYLAGMAALRSGCDWVTIAAPEKVAWTINTMSPDLVTAKLNGDYLTLAHETELHRLIERHDCILIGPGTGLNKNTTQLMVSIIRKTKKPLVIDADAVKNLDMSIVRNAILTPNEHEYGLLRNRSPLGNNIIIRKGRIDSIITASRTYYNRSGNPRMAVAGTGDILAGVCASYISQGCTLLQAAINAAYLIGKYAKEAARHHTNFLASDILQFM